MLMTVVVALATLAPASIAGAAPSENGCNGLYEVARFATFKNGKDTHGHEVVHHQFEAHGCAHAHHD